MKLLTTSLMLMISLSSYAQFTTWYEIPTNTNKQLNTISFGSSMVGYIGGNDSLLLKTTDGGLTWSEVAMSGVIFSVFFNDITNLKFVNETTGFMAVGLSSGVYKTTDGGSNWSLLPVNMCNKQGLFFWDEHNGFIGGSGCFEGELIDIYTDGVIESAIINTSTSFPEDMVVDIDFLDADFGLAVSKSRFLRTTDGGQSWDTIPSGTTHLLTSIEIVNDTLAYAGYQEGPSPGYGLMVTHDGGLTWTMEAGMATFAYPDYNDVGESANGYIYTVGKVDWDTSGMLFDNKGEGWWFYYASHPLNALDTYGDSTVFAVGDSGLVVTNVNPVLSVFEKKVDENPLSVYPNPAADELFFDLGNENSGIPSTVKIWSLRGQLVLEASGVDSRVNVSALSTGSYILEVGYNGRKFSRAFIKK